MWPTCGKLRDHRSNNRIMAKIAKLIIVAIISQLMTEFWRAKGEILFDRVKPIIWLNTKSTVSTGMAYYDINFAYTSPCQLFERSVKAARENNSTLSKDELSNLAAYRTNCNALYIMEWNKEVEQLLSVNLPLYPTDHRVGPEKPYKEPRIEAIRGKRQVIAAASALVPLIGQALTKKHTFVVLANQNATHRIIFFESN